MTDGTNGGTVATPGNRKPAGSVERGRHEALLAADGTYAGMWRRQQEQAEALQRLQRLDHDGLPDCHC